MVVAVVTVLMAGAAWAFAVPAHAAPASAVTAPMAPMTEVEPEATFRTAIETAYATLERYADLAASDLRFELRDFRTLYRGDFGGSAWLDIVTMPDGRLIQVERKAHSTTREDGSSSERVEYVPTWTTKEADWRLHPKTSKAAEVSLAEAFRILEEDDPKFLQARALTTFEVTVSLVEDERTYRAAFVWFSPQERPTWTTFDLLVLDNVTQGVEQALEESIPVEGREFPAPTLSSKPGGRGSTATLAPRETCVANSSSGSFTDQGSGYNSHFSGRHYAYGGFGFVCDCEPSCRQTCNANVPYPVCIDEGNPTDACHKMGFSTGGESRSIASGVTTGATCLAAMRCVQDACPFCGCGVTVTVNVAGSQVSYGGDTGNWSWQRSWGYQCSPCTPDPFDDGECNPGGGLPKAVAGGRERVVAAGCGSSPILVDFGGQGFELTDLDGGVEFDIDADGARERVSWTDPEGGVEFLALDRDGNGVIDAGDELFGDSTPQPESSTPNGYLALAEYDVDEDGVITADDPVFADLLLWHDASHDGLSQPGEMRTVAEAGVVAIEIDYHESRRQDRHGNLFRYQSRLLLEADKPGQRPRPRKTVDVFFIVE